LGGACRGSSDTLRDQSYPTGATRRFIPSNTPTLTRRVALKRSETLKLVIVIAASVASAALVTPTVTQGQNRTDAQRTQFAAVDAVNGPRA
jgi:hypothetical protein